ncbi:MAG: TatA/E family twin arginine-targeting protein translocase [Chloroflexi bacterium]|nr:TatA/E family twin arginine-targeting protein translocase [Chloroflexota bacterium]
MDFFGIGPLEIILILVIGLLIFGPQKLPQIGRDVGKALRSFKKASMSITSEIEKELEDVKKEVKDIDSEKGLEDVRKGLAHFKKELEDIKAEKEPDSRKSEPKIIEVEKQSNP